MVGVGHGCVFEKKGQLVMVLPGAAAFEFREVVPVRGENEVEFREVAEAHLSRPRAPQIISAEACVFDRTRVGGGPDVVILRPGRIDLDVESGFMELCTENGFRSWGAADVTHADDQYAAGKAAGNLGEGRGGICHLASIYQRRD